MFFDYQSPQTLFDGIIVYPDVLSVIRPLANLAVRETVFVTGSTSRTSAVTGTVDDHGHPVVNE